MAPTESVASAAEAAIPALPGSIGRALLEELWRGCDAAGWGLAEDEFERILLEAGTAQNFGLAEGETAARPSGQNPSPGTPVTHPSDEDLSLGIPATRQQQATFFRGLCLNDLVLARACAAGNERAWERFIAVHRQPLIRAAISITGSETLGRELADQLYGELYGLTMRNGERRCPLLSYRGRGSLMGWLRTTLAQRHVDYHRRRRREEPLDEVDAPAPHPPAETPAHELSLLEEALEKALRERNAEERFLLAAYYLDGQTLLQIARVLGVHEATVSRKLRRAAENTRKQVLGNLQRGGMSRRAAQEALGADPRDVDVNLKKLLQNSQTEAFQEQAAP
ncbi:MAG: sigma-70 family RNA polymerase sigma factor [Terracidiphilus sp.]|jgi:RNA polymerase sigma-70 factor (ECF subfamily)